MSIPRPIRRQNLLDYFLEAAKPRAEWLVGMEIEQMPRAVATGRPIPYDGDNASVRAILEFIRSHRECDPIQEGDNLIGLDGDWGSITLEPGGQIEWSSRPQETLQKLAHELEQHLAIIEEARTELGIHWVEEAVDPVNWLSDVYWMPKARYEIMRPYLGLRGCLAHRMMTQTASIQTAFDFASPQDWQRKFKAAALCAPLAIALFANSARIDGAQSGYRCYRQRIWQETDPERCGLPEVVFDPGFDIEAWLDWILDVPTIFSHRAGGLVPAGAIPFGKLLQRTGCCAIRPEDWETHLSTIFTEVRSYRYIEIRCTDLQPPRWMLAVPVFWTGILYHEDSLDAALKLGSVFDDYQAWLDAMDSSARAGLDGVHSNLSLRRLVTEALSISLHGLRRGAATAGDGSRAAQLLEEFAAHRGITL